MKPSGAHTHPGMGGGGTALVVVAVIIAAAVAEPVAHAVSSFLRVFVEALDVIVVVVASAVSLAVVAGLVYFVARLRQRYLLRAAVLRSPQPSLIVRKSAEALSNQPLPLPELEGHHSLDGQRLDRNERADNQPLAIDRPEVSDYQAPVDWAS